MSPSDSADVAPAETRTFADFGVDPALCEALGDAGITEPFPIQELTLPMALAGADVIGQARTGTGKTLAFGLPALQRLDTASRHVQTLVIVPTRELCLQVTEDLEKAGVKLDLSVVALYGGRPIPPQAQALADGAHVAVGTPGRLLDLHQRGVLDLSQVNTLVLDEADEMLDLGFLPDVERLIELCATQRQTLLFSATMPSPVVKLARRYMSQPTFLRAEDDRSDLSPDTSHYFFSCHRLDKPALLARILQAPHRGLCVVFTRTKRMADQLTTELTERQVEAAAIHSDLRQDARERAMQRFRDGKITVLVATEVAARGLDIDDVTHVVNYDCPDDEKMYLHRIGRTGRAGAAGVAITLAVWNELARLEMIKKALGLGDEPTHEVFSTSELVDELFDLPPRTTSAARGGGPRQRGKRGGKSRSAGASTPERTAAEGSPAATAAEDAPAEEPPVATTAEETPAATAEQADDTTIRRTRQRTRTRTRTTERARGEPPARGQGAQQPDAPSPAEPPRGEDRGASPAADGAERSAATSPGGGKRGGNKGGGKRSSGGKRGGQRGGGQRRSGNQPSGRSSGRQRPAVSASAARGEGRPQIRRPLQVQHLP